MEFFRKQPVPFSRLDDMSDTEPQWIQQVQRKKGFLIVFRMAMLLSRNGISIDDHGYVDADGLPPKFHITPYLMYAANGKHKPKQYLSEFFEFLSKQGIDKSTFPQNVRNEIKK